MRPLTAFSITPAFLTDRPFLLLDVSAFNRRYIGSLVVKNAIKSKGGVALPKEIWLEIFKLLENRPKYQLARVVTATDGEVGANLKCTPNSLAFENPLASLKSDDEVDAIRRYLARPDRVHDLSFLQENEVLCPRPEYVTKAFVVTIYDFQDQSLKGLFTTLSLRATHSPRYHRAFTTKRLRNMLRLKRAYYLPRVHWRVSSEI